MRKTLLLTTVAILAIGLVFAWGTENGKVEQPAPTKVSQNADQPEQALQPFQVTRDLPAQQTPTNEEIAAKLAREEASEYLGTDVDQAEIARKEAILAAQNQDRPSTSNKAPFDQIAEKDANVKIPPPPDPNVILQGGDNISTATVISSLPHTSTGTTVGYTNDYDEICPYGPSASPDVVYSYTATADQAIDISLCNVGTDYDTKMYVYDSGMSLIACNDDACPGYISELLEVYLTNGTTYYIIVDGYGGDSGNYELTVDLYVPPPPFDCPAGSISEGEGCGNDTNGGCNADPWAFGSINCGDVVCGSVYADGSTRDTDWYMLNLATPQLVTITVSAEFPFVFGTIEQTGPGDCDNSGYLDVYSTGSAWDTVSVTAVMPLTTGWPAIVFVAPSTYSGIDCVVGDTTYWVQVTCEAAPVSACCIDAPPSCQDLNEPDCNAAGGTWYAGEDCATFTCPGVPANDLCINAESVGSSFPVTISGTTTLATGDNTATCGTSGNANPGVWYSVIGTGNTMTVDLCNGYTTWDSKIQVWCNSCAFPICVGGNDDFCGLQSQVSWCSEEGTEYLVIVYQYGSTGGDFQLTVSDNGTPCSTPPSCVPPTGACCWGDPFAPSCIDGVTEEYCFDTQGGYSWVEGATCQDDPTPCPPVQPGDNCSAPLVIASLPFNDVGQTNCGRGYDYDATCMGSYDGGEDIVYEFTITEETTLQVELDPNGTTWTGVSIDDACPPGASCIAYSTSYSAVAHGFTVTLQAGTYYVMVDTWPSPYCIPDFDLYIGAPPTGRCCDNSVDPYNPVCTDGVVEPNCQGTGQSWAEGLNCNDDPCPLPPANDDCVDAELITGPFPYTATANNIYAPIMDCPSLLNWNAIWYAFDLPYENNFVTIEVCPIGADIYNAGIILMNDCLCDDYRSTGDGGYYEWFECDNGRTGIRLVFQYVPGGARTQWYWPAMVVADAYNTGMEFEFTIDITPPPTGRCCDYNTDPFNPTCTDGVEQIDCAAPGLTWAEGLNCNDDPCPLPPANSTCETAEAITGPYPATGSGSTVAATLDCPDLIAWNGVWYTIELPYLYNNITIDMCPTTGNASNAGIILMDDCACDDYRGATSYVFPYACPSGYNGVQLYFAGVRQGTGTIYWPAMIEDAYGNGMEFDYVVNITEMLPTGPGDYCEDPLTIGALPYNTSGNTCGFLNFCDITGSDNSDVIYEWTVTSEYIYTVSLCGGSDYDTKLAIFLDECCTGPGTEYAYNDDFCGLQSEITMVFIPGTYYVVVDGYGTSCGNYVLDIYEVGPAPTGRCCSGDFYFQTCTEDVTQYQCATTYGGYSWVEGADCTTDPCPVNGHFVVDPTELAGFVEEAGPGNTDSQTLEVTNPGSGTLDFSISVAIDPPPVSSSIMPVQPTANSQLSFDQNYGEKEASYSVAPDPDPNVILQGGDDISTAVAITIPYGSTGTTVGYTDDYEEVCPYSSTSPDVVYSYTSPGGEVIDVDLCLGGTTYDTKLYIYDSALNLIACNDDACPGFISQLIGVSLIDADTYYIIVDGYGGESGAYEIAVNYGTPPPDCEPGDQYSQGPPCSPSESWSFATSDVDLDWEVTDNFAGVFGTIDGIMFWGLDLYWSAGWSECDMTVPEFNIIFYADDGGMPGEVVASYVVTADITATGIMYGGAYELKEFTAAFDPVTLSEGWVTVQSTSAADCAFLWDNEVNNPNGDDESLQNGAATGYDRAFCLSGTYEAPWLTADPMFGSIPPGGSRLTVTVGLDASTLSCGIHTGRLNFTTNDPMNQTAVVPVTFTVCQQGYEYVPGDANMIVGQWPPQVIGGDVTFLVNYFRGVTNACLLGGFFCSGDANGDCNVIGSDVTRMVNYFRGIATIIPCPDFEAAWPTPADCPEDPPAGWPNCETPPVTSGKTIGNGASK